MDCIPVCVDYVNVPILREAIHFKLNCTITTLALTFNDHLSLKNEALCIKKLVEILHVLIFINIQYLPAKKPNLLQCTVHASTFWMGQLAPYWFQ